MNKFIILSVIPLISFNLESNKLNIISTIDYHNNNTLKEKIREKKYKALDHLTHEKKNVSVILIPSYGNNEYINVKGRILKVEKLSTSNNDDSRFKNFMRNIATLTFDEVKGVKVDIIFNGKTTKVQTNNKGIFETKIYGFGKVKTGINEIKAKINKYQPRYSSDTAAGRVCIQNKNDNTFGVISDIDDTIKKSYVTDKLKTARTLLFLNYTTQEKIKGIPELYNILDRVNNGTVDGDIHYVSGSPIQISSLIENFLSYNKFPVGSLDLKVLGFDKESDSLTEQIKYKIGKIRNIFNAYPEKKFLLFGDSGEKDPEIYKQISGEFPERVIGIYINNVTGDNSQSDRYRGMLLTNNTSDAAYDLYKKGIIKKEEFEQVKGFSN